MIFKCLAGLNYGLLSCYGVALAIAFAGVSWNRKNKYGFMVILTLTTLLQIILIQTTKDFDLSAKLYPLAVHLPVVLYLVVYCQKQWLTALAAMLSAYLFTMPRRWLAHLLSFPFEGELAFHIAAVAITGPLVWFVYRFFVRDVREMISRRDKPTRLFVAFLLVYYVFNNATTVFTDILYSGNPAVTDAPIALMVLCFFTLIILYDRQSKQRQEVETLRTGTMKLLDQAKGQIEQLRLNDDQTRMYRHDMRHHLLFMRELAASGSTEKILEYLSVVEKQLDGLSHTAYCGNETVNLIISAFARMAQKEKVTLQVKMALPEALSIDDVQLCTLLSNGLENAIQAAAQVTDGRQRTVRLQGSIVQGRLLIRIENPYITQPQFDKGLPVSVLPNHGLGTKSVRSIVQQNGGLCDFMASEGTFTLRMVL